MTDSRVLLVVVAAFAVAFASSCGDEKTVADAAAVVATGPDPLQADAREIHDLVPGSRLVILPESGHTGHVEEPFAAAFAIATKWSRTC